MVKFAETEDTIKQFLNEYKVKDSIIFPIFQNRTEHPFKNRLLLVLVYIDTDCWVLSDGHNDSLSVDLKILEEGETKKWIFDSKWLLHKLNLKNWKSGDVVYHLMELKSYDYGMIYHSLTSNYRSVSDFSYIPITNIIETVTQFIEENRRYLDDTVSGFERYNDTILPAFNRIERNGIPTEYGMEYSLYNNFTTTGRPTNGFGGVNYSALNKSDGSRDHIVSKLGEFYQYDYDGYHIRLIGKLIGTEIPETSAHEWLGKQYFGKDELTDEDYQNSKAITFRQLYGGIDVENLEIEFYDKTNRFIQTLYKDFLIKGYLQTRFGKRIPFQKIDNHNAQKVFNYYLQALETETNTIVIKKLNELLSDTKTNLVLYTYDSFLFDVDKSETHLIPKIEEILNKVAPTDLSKNVIYGKI
jgi:hypothetical protein